MSESNGVIHSGQLVESRVTVTHSDYNVQPGDVLKVLEVGQVSGEYRVVVEPVHLTGTRLVLPAKAVQHSKMPDNFLELEETERARLGGLGDLHDKPEEIMEDLSNLPDTSEIEYE